MANDQDSRIAWLSLLLGFNGGFVDTAGFLSLQGLFTAHVTGNFVTFGASLVNGTSGSLAKLLALPVFCMAVMAARLLTYRLQHRAQPVVPPLLWIMCVLLALGAGMAGVLGPFPDGDTPTAFWTGMVLVAAMAIQNVVSRAYLPKLPPSTLMTGTTTQVMLDLADLVHGVDGDARAAAVTRLKRMLPAVLAFAMGCAIGALLYLTLHQWCFVLAPMVVLTMLFTQRRWLPQLA